MSKINVGAQGSIQVTFLLILFFVLPLPLMLSNVAIGLILLFSFFESFKKKAFPKIHMFWFLPALFLYYILSEFITGDEWSSMEKRFTLLAIPLLFSLNPNFLHSHLRIKIYLSFVLGNLTAVIICLIRAMSRSLTFSGSEWQFNPKVIHATNYDFLTSAVMGGNYFFGDEFSAFLDSIYFGIYIVFAQFLIFEIFKAQKGKTSRLLLVVCYLIFFVVLFLLSSKSAIISSLLLALYIVFYILFKTGVPFMMRGLTVISLVGVSIVFIYFNPRFTVFKDTFWQGLNFNPTAKYGHNLRVLSWDASQEIIKHNWLFGVGEANKTLALVKVYNSKGYTFLAQQMFNSHNQYLDFLIGGGIVCFGLYMTGLTQLLIISIRLGNYSLLAFLLIFSFSALFENLLSRHAGLLIFSLFICLLNSKPPFDDQT